MTDPKPDAVSQSYAAKFDDIDRELVHVASICRVDLLDRANIERVIRNDASVCGVANPVAFEKLRELLMMHYAVRTRAAQALGEAGAQALIDETVTRIRERLERLGVIR
jgi:methylaspartate ammonia-lyase